MEKLNYLVEDSTIAQLLGEQNFTNKESAVLELVKNAFDANATFVEIRIAASSIIISDDGEGMNAEDIKSNWMHVGKSKKGYELKQSDGKTRIVAGEKGIGRFALAKLGKNVKVFSQKKAFPAIMWETDWNGSFLTEMTEESNTGTKIEIINLHDRWTKKAVSNLALYLSNCYNDDKMKIIVKFNDEDFNVNKRFIEPLIGINFSSIINLRYDSKSCKLFCSIKSDEFQVEAQKYCKSSINEYSTTIDLIKEFKGRKLYNEIVGLNDMLTSIGDFFADLYFGIANSSTDDIEKFLYKRKTLIDPYKTGVILYRNAFSISSYEGKKDWLELGKRFRKSPAAASHPTGSWRVRENQISGRVVIDKKDNEFLRDLSNRQGLNENEYYELFINIIHIGLETFERYRQSIIREINKKNVVEIEKEQRLVDTIIKKPSVLDSLSSDEKEQLIKELKVSSEELVQQKKDKESTEKRYKYDVRLLNVLATSGLKATSIAHEMRNDKKSIETNYDDIVKALQYYDLWEFLSEYENTRFTHRNVPKLLERNKDISNKIVVFMKTMLEEVEKSQFVKDEYDVSQLLLEIKRTWERDYAWINIEYSAPEDETFIIAKDTIKVIFDNLILNSVQQNEAKNKLNVFIQVNYANQKLEFLYKDDGAGLDAKYHDNPYKILEPHETSRKKGHGLGMWIVNNTIEMTRGNIIEITGKEGFAIRFVIGE